jgi:hypothetical protein
VSNKKPTVKPILSSCWHILKLRERSSYSGLLQYIPHGAIILNQRQEGSPWNGIILNLLTRKNSQSPQEANCDQRCKNPGFQVAVATKFCTVVLNTGGTLKWNLLHVTLVVLRIFRWLINFW